MNFVLDSSLTFAFLFADEATDNTDKLLYALGQGGSAFVPALWHWEVGNGLFQAERRKRITPADTNRHLTALRSLPVETDENATGEAWNSTLLLARKHGLTIYDAAYLEVAIRHGLPLGSLDAELRKAAKTEGVKVLPDKC